MMNVLNIRWQLDGMSGFVDLEKGRAKEARPMVNLKFFRTLHPTATTNMKDLSCNPVSLLRGNEGNCIGNILWFSNSS